MLLIGMYQFPPGNVTLALIKSEKPVLTPVYKYFFTSGIL